MENLSYDEEKDEFICPAGKKIIYTQTINYLTTRRCYECEDCSNCSLKERYTKATGNRKFKISFALRKFKRKAAERLCF